MFIAPRWRKVLRDLTANRARTLLVILSIAVGVFAVGSVAGARTILSRDLAAQYAVANDASAQIFASSMDADFARSIERMPEVAVAQSRSAAVLRVPLADGKRSNIIVHVIEDFDQIDINRFRFERGAGVPPRRELLIERSSLGLFQRDIGDALTIELGDGKTRDMRIAGTVFDVTAPPVQFANFGTAFITRETWEWLGYPSTFNQLRIIVAERGTDREHIQRVVDAVKERIEDSGRQFFGVNISQNPGRHYADEQIQAMLLILNVLGALAMFLSAFLVTNAISAVMAQQIRQIGIMKSIGGRTRHIVAQYLLMVTLFGVIALLVSVPFGTLGAQGLAGFVSGLLNFDILTRGVPPDVLAIEIAVGLVVPIIAAIVPIASGTRMTVREAITNQGATSSSAKPINREAMSSGLLSWLPRPLLLSLRNTFRRVGRLLLTVGTLTLASAIFVSVFSVRDALYGTLNTSLAYWNYDLEVTFKTTHGEEKVRRALDTVPGVVLAETWSTAGARRVRADKSESRGFAVVAPPIPTNLLNPTLTTGRWLLADDPRAIVINTEVLADEPDLGIGSTVELKIGSRTRAFTVVGVVQGTLTGQVRNPRTVYLTQSALREAYTFGRQTSSAVVVTERSDAAFRSDTAKRIEAAMREANMPIDTTETLDERRNQIAFQFDLLITFLLLMAGLLGIVGGLGLAGTMSINVVERTREIGVLRAIGGTGAAIRRIVMAEGAIIGLLSWSLGALLAVPISYALNIAVGEAFLRRPLPFTYSGFGLGVWLVTILIVGLVSSALPAWRASRLTVREVLAYE
jgi:putative ABC transport system permease protein